MTALATEHQPLARELQQSAVVLLARLLTTELPALTWHIPRAANPLYTTKPRAFPALDGLADSYAAVCSWAAHLGADIELSYGDTPTARTVIDGIGVRVWCAPQDRDDLAPVDQDGQAAA